MRQGTSLRVNQRALERQSDALVVVIVHFKACFISCAVAGGQGAKLMKCHCCAGKEGCKNDLQRLIAKHVEALPKNLGQGREGNDLRKGESCGGGHGAYDSVRYR